MVEVLSKKRKVPAEEKGSSKRIREFLEHDCSHVVSVKAIEHVVDKDVMKEFLESENNLLMVKRQVQKVTGFLQDMIGATGNMPFIENERLTVSEISKCITELFEEFFAENEIAEEFMEHYRECLKSYARDVEQIASVSVKLAKCDSSVDVNKALVELTLEGVDTDGCKYFHQDYNHLRTLCTYLGPATQWVENKYVNRDVLKTRDHPANEQIVQGFPDNVHNMQTGWVSFLKGGAYPGNENNAIVHRSPPVEEEGLLRVVLRIDVL